MRSESKRDAQAADAESHPKKEIRPRPEKLQNGRFVPTFRIACTLLILLSCALQLQAQYYTLGRSPHSIRWNYIETPSGRIIYPNYFERGAAQTSTFLHALSPTVFHGFTYGPLRTPIVLHTQNFQANGLVIWAPLRMELQAIPPINPYAEPWLKQLAAHEVRHAVQYSNQHRGWLMNGLNVLLGEQSGLISTVVYLPIWAVEGDATMAETQAFEFGRALQPSFTIEYRAYFREDEKLFRVDKWFCGSFRDFIPDHYQFGYQIVAWAREQYGDDFWKTILDYSVKRPHAILSMNFPASKFYNTTIMSVVRRTLNDLTCQWKALPEVEESGEIIPTPWTSFSFYDTPMTVNDSTVVVMKTDMDRPNRFVRVDPRTGRERHLFYTGLITTPPVLRDDKIYWGEYRYSALWDQRIFSRAVQYDLTTGRRRTLNDRTNALFPTPLPDGELATVGYDYSGYYTLDFNEGKRFNFPDSLSVHGLAYDDPTRTLAFIGLSDAGMAFYSIDPGTGEIDPITAPTRITVFNLRAGAGKLSYNSIESGKDEIHIYDLIEQREYRLTTSQYGSLSPSEPTADSLYYFAAYTRNGYRLARQTADPASLHPVEPSYIPQDVVNPDRRKWNVVQLDTVASQTRLDSTLRVKRYRQAGHMFNLHSWTPWNFNPFMLASEDRIDVSLGATVMSQNLLSNTSGFLAWGYRGDGGHQIRGLLNYEALPPKFQIGFDYGGRHQPVYGAIAPETRIPARRPYAEYRFQVSLPMIVGSDFHVRILTPSVSIQHLNGLLYFDNTFKTGFQRIVSSVNYTDIVRLAQRDFLPRWGYTFRVTSVNAPFNVHFADLLSLYGRLYLPGIVRPHSLVLRGSVQWQKKSDLMFNFKEIYPRGAFYDFPALRYRAAAVDYQFPVAYPDWGWNSIIFLKRIRLNTYFDFARLQRFAFRNDTLTYVMQNFHSYGGEVFLDTSVFRTPVNLTTIGFYVYKPSDRNGVVTGFSVGLPF